MNNPTRVIGFVNAGHFIDHYSMLIFAAAVIIMGPALGMAYSELLPYATPGFVAFGAGSLLTGWLGDRWSRRHMMVIFFVGIGASMISSASSTRRSNSALPCCRLVCSPRSITPSAPR
jgi:MFS family permease